MRLFLMFLGVVFVATLSLAISWQRTNHYDQVELSLESRQYADDAIRATVRNWSEDTLLARASPELAEAAENKVDLHALFDRWSRLGTMVRYGGAKGSAHVVYNWETGRIITAYYVAHAAFEHGSADIVIGLVKRADGWRVASFTIDLFQRPTPPRNLHTVIWRPALRAELADGGDDFRREALHRGHHIPMRNFAAGIEPAYELPDPAVAINPFDPIDAFGRVAEHRHRPIDGVPSHGGGPIPHLF